MKNRTYLLNTILAVVVGIAMLAIMLVHTFLPNIIIPKVSVPNLMILSLIALLLDYYLAKGASRCYICIPLMSALTFGILPLVAGFACQHSFWKLGLVGGAVCTATVWLFSSMADRLLSGPKAKAAAFLSALGLYLAAQCFTGILL